MQVGVGGSCVAIEINSCLVSGCTCSALVTVQVHGERGGSQEHLADAWIFGFEDDHRNRPFGTLLVAGVALENRGDPGPELVPLLFGGGAGDHGTSRACSRGAYLWVGLEVEVPRRVPVIAAERGHQHQAVAVRDRYREHRRALLARAASGG